MKRKLFYAVLVIAILTWAFSLPLSPSNNPVVYGDSEDRLGMKKDTSRNETNFYIITDKETGCKYMYAEMGWNESSGFEPLLKNSAGDYDCKE